MVPLPDGVTDLRSGFKNKRSHAPLEDMSSGGQTDWPGTNDGDCFTHILLLLDLSKFKTKV
jgi:hypothetical protein